MNLFVSIDLYELLMGGGGELFQPAAIFLVYFWGGHPQRFGGGGGLVVKVCRGGGGVGVTKEGPGTEHLQCSASRLLETEVVGYEQGAADPKPQ